MRQSTAYRSWVTSYELNIGDIWDIHRLTEKWHVERVDGQALKPNDVANIIFELGAGAPVIPDIGDPYQFPTGGLGTTLMESMLVRSHQWGQPDGKGINVTVNYETRYFEANAAKGITGYDPSAGTILSRQLILPCELLPIFMSRNTRLYRDPVTTAPPAGLDITAADIGGTAKDVDVDVKQIGLKLRLVVDSNSLPIAGYPVLTNGLVGVISAYLGKKNSVSFFNFAAGSLVCSGATINHLESEFYEVAMEYLYDEYFHHSQYAVKASDGRVEMDNANPKTVYWTRPVRGAVNFDDIFPAGDLGKSQRYQACAGRWY